MLQFVFLLTGLTASLVTGSKNHILFWNTTNPIFRLDHSSHQRIRVNEGNMPGQYDQLHLICPDSSEQHVVYSVSRLEFETCRINSPDARIVALCTRPELYTITFRSVSPTPGSPVFEPGKTYYLISTSSARDLYKKAGGYCSTHNMKMMFDVADNRKAVRMHNTKDDKIIDNLDKKLSSQFQRQFSRSSSLNIGQPEIKILTSNTLPTEIPFALPRISSLGESTAINQSRNKKENPPTTTRQPSIQRKYFGEVYQSPGRSTGQVRASEYLYYYTPRDMVHLKSIVNRHMKSIAKEEVVNEVVEEEERELAEMLTSSCNSLVDNLTLFLGISLIFSFL